MSVRQEQENLLPRVPFSTPSSCMVLKGDTIPASLQSFPGMEHDRSLFNGLAQETPSNSLSQFIGDSNTFDDEREIEAAAAASEAQLASPFVTSASVQIPATEHSVVSPPVASSIVPSNLALSPLHINVNECSKLDLSDANSRDSDLPRNGLSGRRKMFQQPFPRTLHRTSTSSGASVIMGPPSNTNTQVLLSPAGNFHNGYQRISSGDSAPSSPSFMSRQLSRGNQQAHPPVSIRNPPQNRVVSTSAFGQSGRSPSSLSSPLGSGRKDHEMTRRRALVDRITKSRGPDYVHLLPQVEGLSHTQTSIMLRKHRGTLQSEGMPYSMQQLIDCGSEHDITEEIFVKKIKEANQKRKKHSDPDEITDISDIEDDLSSPSSTNLDRRSPKNVPRWAPKRMRYAGMLSRVETLLAEKHALLGMLKTQRIVMNGSCGVRFAGEEMIPRRRRQLNGMYFLYDKSTLRRTSAGQYGCSRTMPIQSWTKRDLQKNVFDESKDERIHSAGPAVVKPSSNPLEKWVATAQYNTVSYLLNGEKREVTEYDYEEYKAGEGLQRVNELSAIDPLDFIVSSDFTPFEDRQMAYMYRLSTAPSNTIRKKHGKAIYFETDDRKISEQSSSAKKKIDKKKERKPVEEASSDEEEVKTIVKKRPRGRPLASASKRKSSKMSVTAKLNNGIYLDYLFEDFMNEDICVKQLPTTVTYKSIHVPDWYKISENYWEEVPGSQINGETSDDLLLSVAKQHHKLMHAERERIRRETDKRIRNRQSALKSAAATPAHNPFHEDGDNGNDYPPFDMKQFEQNAITSRRRYASVEKPYEQRNFLKNYKSESTK